MTDGLVEEIYALAREAFIGGQDGFQVHAFPFRMTDANLARFPNHPAMKFWASLKDGYDYFELTRQAPQVAVCERKYVVNPKWRSGIVPAKLDAEHACPAYERVAPEPFKPALGEQIADAAPVVVAGPKMRRIASSGMSAQPATGGMSSMFGLGSRQASTPSFGLAPQ